MICRRRMKISAFVALLVCGGICYYILATVHESIRLAHTPQLYKIHNRMGFPSEHGVGICNIKRNFMFVKEETWEESEQKVRNLLKDKLQLDPKKVEIERAHRNGRFQADRRPRSIVTKLLRYKDKQGILQRAKNLKGTHIFINEDYSEAFRQKRRELIPELKAARERGNVAYLRFDRLIVHPPRQTSGGDSQKHHFNEGSSRPCRPDTRSSGAEPGASAPHS
ncbi:Hypp1974 [Branchiostoma lanceolatum]|uniref:Hypp1974 protein n=1 Tax=Branchiostoma lanceolatum TaxID=7740 RepID=A0A8J9ZMN2_BRALA|nr:Hypp1974 [Branchiostoma lanceolatum]